MTYDTKQWLVLPLLLLAANFILQHHVVHGDEPQVPCLFIFGDSSSDSGNNNPLATSVKANYRPYGIDLPDGAPTGRFTNGLTSIDIITQLLGFQKLIPPFANNAGSNILKGVNYGSGAAGIRYETGKQLGTDISLGLQLTNHKTIVSQISAILGRSEKVQQHLNKCLYHVNIGANDYLNNYFLPHYYPTSNSFTLDQYAVDLIQKYSLNIRGLYDLGARKFVLVGVGLIGCTPRAIFTHGNNSSSCVDEMNIAAMIFNSKLKSLVDQFNNELSNAKFIFINSTTRTLDNPSLGFKVLNSGCCKVGENGLCVPNVKPCENRKEYVFFDSFHPTEAANRVTAIASYNASNPAFTYPMDISHLVHS